MAESQSVQQAIEFAESVLPGVAAPDGECCPRWQAIIEVGSYVESNPEEVWEFVVRWGRHADKDLRMAIAVLLLEHLLEHHFDLIFPRVREIAERDPAFAETFCSCWKGGQSELPINASKMDELKRRCTTGDHS